MISARRTGTRKTDLVSEADRRAEQFYNETRNIGDISTQEGFDKALLTYLGQDRFESQQQKQFSKEVYTILRTRKPNLLQKERHDQKIFRQAGGKNLTQDRKRNARTIVKTRKEYIKRGARNVDLDGLDTKKGLKAVYKYEFVGIKKGKVVQSRQIKTKRGLRLIDRRGQYVSRKT